ncbi:MAG: YceI family protein [Opitutaceae bacterium]|nr:YceI family protein [Opitutaceae bacterium]
MKPVLLAMLLSAVVSLPLFAAPKTLEVNKAQSTVEIVVKATVDSFTGRLADYQPTLIIDSTSGKVTAASVAFRFADVKTGKEDRDKQMLTWAEEPKHPDGIFTLTEIQPDTVAGRHNVKGTLRFHGVEQLLEFPVSITTNQQLYSFDGEAILDTRTFGLPVIRKFGLLKVDPLVKVRFHLQAAAATP